VALLKSEVLVLGLCPTVQSRVAVTHSNNTISIMRVESAVTGKVRESGTKTSIVRGHVTDPAGFGDQKSQEAQQHASGTCGVAEGRKETICL
jgi:hypothetical protein